MKNTTYLQTLGNVKGTPVSELSIGDTVIWNFGQTSIVEAISKETKAFIWIIFQENGKTYPARKMKKSRIVARPKNER